MRWKLSDELKLRRNYNDKSLIELAEMFPNRSYLSVSAKARSMGLRKYKQGVKFIHNNGYVVVRNDDYPQDWSGAWKREGWGTYVYEHALVWWRRYPNRKISDKDIIHHKDGNKTNNDINNLQKMTRSQHASVTFYDEWANVPGAEAMMPCDVH